MFGFIYDIMALMIVTSGFKVLYRMSGKFLALVPFISSMAGKVFVMTHALLEYHKKVKKSGGAFKLFQQFSCTTIVACWIERVEGHKKVVYEPKVKTASMTCKTKEKNEELL